MSDAKEDRQEELRHELAKQLIIAAVMIVSVIVAAYVEREASAPDLPGPLTQLIGRWKAMRQQEEEWQASRKRMLFELHCLLPGALR